MKTRGVIFNADEVLAAQANRKMEFRRAVKPQPVFGKNTLRWELEPDGTLREVARIGKSDSAIIYGDRPRRCPFGVPGDRLWVRETWCDVPVGDGGDMGVIHKADGEDAEEGIAEGWEFMGRWRSPATMPRRASRILLEVTAARVERVDGIWLWVTGAKRVATE